MYAQDWNLAIQREITPSLGVEVAYVGTKGTHLQLTQNVNQPFVTDGIYGSKRPYAALPLTSPIVPAQCLAPNPDCPYGLSTRSTAWEIELQLALGDRREAFFARVRISDFVHVAKSLTTIRSTGETYIPQNSHNPRGDMACRVDVRHRFVLSGTPIAVQEQLTGVGLAVWHCDAGARAIR